MHGPDEISRTANCQHCINKNDGNFEYYLFGKFANMIV